MKAKSKQVKNLHKDKRFHLRIKKIIMILNLFRLKITVRIRQGITARIVRSKKWMTKSYKEMARKKFRK